MSKCFLIVYYLYQNKIPPKSQVHVECYAKANQNCFQGNHEKSTYLKICHGSCSFCCHCWWPLGLWRLHCKWPSSHCLLPRWKLLDQHSNDLWFYVVYCLMFVCNVLYFLVCLLFYVYIIYILWCCFYCVFCFNLVGFFQYGPKTNWSEHVWTLLEELTPRRSGIQRTRRRWLGHSAFSPIEFCTNGKSEWQKLVLAMNFQGFPKFFSYPWIIGYAIIIHT